MLAAVLGLGAVALLADKLFLGGHADAAAAAPPEAPTAATTAAEPAASLPGPVPAATSRVGETLLAALHLRKGDWTDAELQASLRPTPAWALYADPEQPKAAPARSLEGRFCEKYRLTGVIGRDESATALIEQAGEKQPLVLKLGAVIDGFRLVKVDDGVAYFRVEVGNEQAQLRVSKELGKP